MKIKTIKSVINLEGKRVLLRADLNVPIENNKVVDDFKLISVLGTINYLQKKKAKIIIFSHLGRPKPGKIDSNYSLKPVAKRLEELLNEKINFVGETIGFKADTAISKLKNSRIVILENVRFLHEELQNSIKLAKKYANLADYYVNDAFGVSHRAQSSLSAIKNFLPSYAGFLVEKELNHLNKIIKPKKPLIIVLGGVKLKTKIKLIEKLYKKADKIIIGGAMANSFLKAHNYNTGKSEIEEENIKNAKRIIKNNQINNIVLPIDVITTTKEKNWQAKAKNLSQVNGNDYIFDIGPQTIKLYSQFIRKANTIIWNGPLGLFEEKPFRHGTLAIARLIAARSKGKAYGIVGGGETVEALHQTKMSEHIDWISTGGGAMLSFLSSRPMPGLEGLFTK